MPGCYWKQPGSFKGSQHCEGRSLKRAAVMRMAASASTASVLPDVDCFQEPVFPPVQPYMSK